MVAFTFVCKKDGDSWAATRLDSEEGEALTAEADDTYRWGKRIAVDRAETCIARPHDLVLHGASEVCLCSQ